MTPITRSLGEDAYAAVGGLAIRSKTSPPPTTLAQRFANVVGKFWCRKFHRQHRECIGVIDNCVTIRCSRCGRKFKRERHHHYSVC